MDARSYEGASIANMFVGKFMNEVSRNARVNASYTYTLNRVGMSDVVLNCENASASEFVEFIDELTTQLDINNVAVVFCNAWNTLATICIVCSED